MKISVLTSLIQKNTTAIKFFRWWGDSLLFCGGEVIILFVLKTCHLNTGNFIINICPWSIWTRNISAKRLGSIHQVKESVGSWYPWNDWNYKNVSPSSKPCPSPATDFCLIFSSVISLESSPFSGQRENWLSVELSSSFHMEESV